MSKSVTGMRDGQLITIEVDVEEDEVDRRKAAVTDKRAQRNPPMIDGTVLLGKLEDLEWMAIQAAAQSNAQISRWVTVATATNQINLASADTIAAKDGLVEAGLLTKERADIVFAAP